MAACGSAGDSDLEPAVAKIESFGCSGADPAVGSGTLIGGDRILTVAHALAGAERIEVITVNGERESAVVVGIDQDRDLAVLAVAGIDQPMLRLIDVAAGAVGEILGYGSAAGGNEPVRLEAVVERPVDLTFSNDDAAAKARPGYELRLTVELGDSGAGLLVDGGLAAVIFGASTERSDRTWATGAEPIRELLEAIEAGTAPTNPAPCPA